MIRLLTAVLLFASFHAVAQTQVPNVFEDGTPASAAEVNANFDALETAIDAIPEGPAGPQGEQGPAGADGVAAGLNCTTDQSIVYRGDAWVCSSPEVVYESFTEFAFCPPDKKVTGGGCVFEFTDDCERTMSRPFLDLSAWACEAFSLGGGICGVERVYAICQ